MRIKELLKIADQSASYVKKFAGHIWDDFEDALKTKD